MPFASLLTHHSSFGDDSTGGIANHTGDAAHASDGLGDDRQMKKGSWKDLIAR